MSRPFLSFHISDLMLGYHTTERLIAKECENGFVHQGFQKIIWFKKKTHLISLLPLCLLLIIQDLFDMRQKGQMYSMLISSAHAQSKSSPPSDGLKSSPHTDWSNSPLQPLLLPHASCKCDNVLCSEIHTISVHLAPNVSKMPVSFSGWMAVMVGERLIARVDLGKRSPMDGSCLTACHQPFKA